MFPLLLNLTGRLCVVIGGGSVGQRKASALLAAGARVRLVCLEPPSESMTDARLEWLQEAYEPRHLDDACLIFAAATPEVNTRVVQDAHARGLWVNRADEPDEGDFILPAVLRRGDVTVAVGTGGASPSLAQTIRDHLEPQFDDALTAWAALLAELRPEVLRRVADSERRRELFAALGQWEWLEHLRREGVDATRSAMRRILEQMCAPPRQSL
jgi:siroheme synthase-like protein